MKKLEVGIIGCGLIGEKRGVALSQFPDCHLKSVYDVNLERSRQLAEKSGCSVVQSSDEIFGDKEIGIVMVSPINKYIAQILLEPCRMVSMFFVRSHLAETWKRQSNYAKWRHGPTED